VKTPTEIRATIKLINDNARFAIPKYLSCYATCVAHWYSNVGRDDLAIEVSAVADLLETGVTERTTLSLVALGLSRTAAVEVGGLIPSSELNVGGVVTWLTNTNLRALNLSSVIIREAERAAENADYFA